MFALIFSYIGLVESDHIPVKLKNVNSVIIYIASIKQTDTTAKAENRTAPAGQRQHGINMRGEKTTENRGSAQNGHTKSGRHTRWNESKYKPINVIITAK